MIAGSLTSVCGDGGWRLSLRIFNNRVNNPDSLGGAKFTGGLGSKMVKDPVVKSFAEQTLPTLREHLKEAEQITPKQQNRTAGE